MSKYKFDPASGTMVPVEEEMAQEPVTMASSDISVPEDTKGSVGIIREAENPNVDDDEDDDEPEIIFKKFKDMRVMRIDDQATNTWLCYFAGYALDIRFNIEELRRGNATKKMEACLEGLNKLFRKILLDQAIGSGD